MSMIETQESQAYTMDEHPNRDEFGHLWDVQQGVYTADRMKNIVSKMLAVYQNVSALAFTRADGLE